MRKQTHKKGDTPPRETDFSRFFIHASDEEKKRVLEDVLRKANADQRAILDEYDRKFAKAV